MSLMTHKKGGVSASLFITLLLNEPFWRENAEALLTRQELS